MKTIIVTMFAVIITLASIALAFRVTDAMHEASGGFTWLMLAAGSGIVIVGATISVGILWARLKHLRARQTALSSN